MKKSMDMDVSNSIKMRYNSKYRMYNVKKISDSLFHRLFNRKIYIVSDKRLIRVYIYDSNSIFKYREVEVVIYIKNNNIYWKHYREE